MNKVHNVKVKTLFLIHSVFMKVLQSVLAFVGESMALWGPDAACAGNLQQVKYSFSPCKSFPQDWST